MGFARPLSRSCATLVVKDTPMKRRGFVIGQEFWCGGSVAPNITVFEYKVRFDLNQVSLS